MSEKKKNIVTPAGKLLFPQLNKPDDHFANGDPDKAVYSTLMILAEDEIRPVLDAIESEYEEFYAKQCKEQKKSKLKRSEFPWAPALNAEKEEIPGELCLRFKMRSKTAKGVEIRPVLVDAKKQPIDREKVIIGGGSIAKISFQPYFWFVPSLGVGVTLQMRGVQVLELQQWTGTDCGFDEEEGYEASASEDDFGASEGGNGDF